ncbi:serine hydrolase [Streptomyces sp. NPDC088910]|uniref:serine hydrolase n=1 Tax=Streptomyces sp. NPDC088910 TaxID=3365911 RepID=UPI0037F7E084
MDDEQTSGGAGGDAGSGAGDVAGDLATDTAWDDAGNETGSGAAAHWWTRRPLVVSTTTLAVIAVLTLATVIQSPSARAGADGKATSGATDKASPSPAPTTAKPFTPAQAPSTATPSTTTPPTTAPPSPSAAPPQKTTATAARDTQAELRAAIKALSDTGSGHFSVAVTELGGDSDDSGSTVATYDSGDTTAYDTASIVKVDILAALLLRHQRAGTQLTSEQRDLATDMIEQSDNDAALALWEAIGGGPGLASANASLGLSHTTPGSGELWGLTQTTAADQITLLRAVYGDGDDSPLSAASRDYISDLMHAVTADQRWGVSAADSDGGDYALKNGWLPRSATGLWDVNSIGKVEHDGHTLLVAVLSGGHVSEQDGIALVERVAEAAAKAVT